MKRKKPSTRAEKPLMNYWESPMNGVRFMQISGLSFSPSVPMEKTSSSSPSPKAVTDQAVMNFSSDSFSSLVQQASELPEVRSDLVDSFKARIQAGQYPDQDTLSGLADAIGGGIVQQAGMDSSSL
jgi:hypothetical protein